MRFVSKLFIFGMVAYLAMAAQQVAGNSSTTCKDVVAAGCKDTAPQPSTDPSTPANKDSANAAAKDTSAITGQNKDKDPAGPAGDNAAAQSGADDAVAAKDTPTQPGKAAPVLVSDVSDRIFAQEAALVKNMNHYTPLVETYVQNLKADSELVAVPGSDRYFLGRMVIDPTGVKDLSFKDKRSAFMYQVMDRLNSFFRLTYHNGSFMQMVFLSENFDKDHYELKYLRRQFLGEVRTLVFDVVPKSTVQHPYFLGRIWVEDQDYNIVRFNGSYGPNNVAAFHLHFDSWRVNMQPGLWLPAYIYTEESKAQYSAFESVTMKGQTRLWAYDLKHSGQQSELTTMQIDSKDVTDDSGRSSNEISPVQSQHLWEREAEDNVLERLERAGILAPEGEVSKILQTVVTNLEITNNLNIDPEVRCRVLLTTPLESFTVGHTIVISRGLLDVMPDEATLAMVLAQELGHIALGHRIDTRYSFSDRMLFPDERVFKEIGMEKNDFDEHEADAKGLELLQKSPYKEKMSTAGLFLRALDARKRDIPWLISARFGNRFTRSNLIHVTAEDSAPQLEMRNIAQLPALPLGSRIKLDPWDDHIEMQKGRQVPLVSARDKMFFEVTPMFPNLVRYSTTPANNAVAATKPAQ